MNKKYLIYGGVGLAGVLLVTWYMKRRRMMAPMGPASAMTVFS